MGTGQKKSNAAKTRALKVLIEASQKKDVLF
jgi:hypothetical protein